MPQEPTHASVLRTSAFGRARRLCATMIHFQAARHRFFQLQSLTERTAMTEPSAGAEMPPPAWQMSACLEILDDIQEQIRFADSKAGFIAAFNVLLFGFVANHMDKLRTLWSGKTVGNRLLVLALVLVAIYVASMVITFGLVVSCVISRFGGRRRRAACSSPTSPPNTARITNATPRRSAP